MRESAGGSMEGTDEREPEEPESDIVSLVETSGSGVTVGGESTVVKGP